ncbi:hypothetical protein [Edaphobacter sp.]|uniref:hypothetical protein n=1 Tax=Edaphobacter sp. TaxID=1934404 RepID=UPI002DBEEC5D|nr:hypothetical protein [Edaphobacter sp.]HEU5340311.1 hypothetical protein [Edaphobacter sp.]
MKLPLLAALAGLVLMTSAAQAQNQVGVYINPIVSRISNPADTGLFAFLGPNTSSRIFAGFDMGGYDDFSHSPSNDIGVDVRGSFLRGNGAFLGSFLVGPRVVFKPSSKMKPYVEALIGVARSRPPHNPRGLSAFQYGILGGVDYSFSSHVDFRMFEVGYSAAQTIGSGVFGGTGTTGTNTSKMLNVSTGLVFRFK